MRTKRTRVKLINRPEKPKRELGEIRNTMAHKWKFIDTKSFMINARKNESLYDRKQKDRNLQERRALELERRIYDAVQDDGNKRKIPTMQIDGGDDGGDGGDEVGQLKVFTQMGKKKKLIGLGGLGTTSPTPRSRSNSIGLSSLTPGTRSRSNSLGISGLPPSFSPVNPLGYSDPFEGLKRMTFTGEVEHVEESAILPVPKFTALHPLSEIKESIDFPAELRIDDYEDDPVYCKYKERLAQESKRKFKKIDGYGAWFVPPKKWTKYMETMKDMTLNAKDDSETQISPLSPQKQNHLDNLPSSKKFKEYLIRTHSEIPDWLQSVHVPESILQESLQNGPISNTAIPQALIKFAYQRAEATKKAKKEGTHIRKRLTKESVLEKNRNDIRYVEKHMKKLKDSGCEEYSVPLSTMIKLTAVRRREREKKRQEGLEQSALVFATAGSSTPAI